MTAYSRHIRVSRLSDEEMKEVRDWKGLPEDLRPLNAKLIGETRDIERHAWNVVLWSEQFSEVGIDEIVPRIERNLVPKLDESV